MRNRLLLATLPFLIASAAPRDPGVLALQALDLKVATIGHRIAISNTARCPIKAPQTGLILHSLGQYPRAARAMMARDFQVASQPTVQAVVAGGAGQRSGLRANDVLMSINGADFPSSLSAKPDFHTIERAEMMIDDGLAKGVARLGVARGGKTIALSLASIVACPSRFQVMPSTRLYANAAGRYVQVSSALIEATRDEDELAFVIAHEMAHNIKAHRERLKRGGRSTAAIRATEVEADAFALILMNGAGYDPHAAARLWARIGDRMDAGPFRDGSHMSPAKRTLFLRDQAIALTNP